MDMNMDMGKKTKQWANSHKKEIAIAAIFLAIGMIVAPQEVKTKEVVKTECKGLAICEQNLGICEQIKVIDNDIMFTQGLVITLAGEGFEAISRLDYVALDKSMAQVENLLPVLEELMEQRNKYY